MSLMLLMPVLYGNGDAADNMKESSLAPPVDDLVAEALEKSPAIGAVRSKFAASRELIEPASALPDPELEFALEENISSLSSPVFAKGEIVLKQEFPFPGKRSVKGKAAGAESEMEYAGLSISKGRLQEKFAPLMPDSTPLTAKPRRLTLQANL